jgi:hypothetical protein
MTEQQLLEFQIKRQVTNIYKDFLFILEEKFKYIKELEDVLVEIGVDKYKESKTNFQTDRGRVLSKGNDCIRELNSLIDSFEISLKRDDNPV